MDSLDRAEAEHPNECPGPGQPLSRRVWRFVIGASCEAGAVVLREVRLIAAVTMRIAGLVVSCLFSLIHVGILSLSVPRAEAAIGAGLFQNGTGDDDLRRRLAAVEERIRGVATTKELAASLEFERNELRIRLARSALADGLVSDTEPQFVESLELLRSFRWIRAHAASKAQELSAISGPDAMRLVAGVLIVVAVAFVVTISARRAKSFEPDGRRATVADAIAGTPAKHDQAAEPGMPTFEPSKNPLAPKPGFIDMKNVRKPAPGDIVGRLEFLPWVVSSVWDVPSQPGVVVEHAIGAANGIPTLAPDIENAVDHRVQRYVPGSSTPRLVAYFLQDGTSVYLYPDGKSEIKLDKNAVSGDAKSRAFVFAAFLSVPEDISR